MDNRALITTADFDETKKPVIFLGNWCLHNLNKHRWLNMNYKSSNSEILILKFSKITLSIKKYMSQS